MSTFQARDYLPDWLMVLFAIVFVLVPLYASFYKHESNAWKARMFAFSWAYLIVVFLSQQLANHGVYAYPLDNPQMQTFLSRAGIIWVGLSGCILALNGMNNDIIRRLIRFTKKTATKQKESSHFVAK